MAGCPPSIEWTPERDATITTGRAAGKTWGEIAAAVGCSSTPVMNRAKVLGVWTPKAQPVRAAEPDPQSRPPERLPLSAGHEETWALLNSLLSVPVEWVG